MAYRPSKRMKHGTEYVQPNITPMMNLMVVLIPLLLTSAEFVQLGVIELNLPPAAEGEAGSSSMPSEDVRKLDLTVTITDKGFFISTSMAVLGSEGEEEQSVPMKRTAGDSLVHDYTRLSEKLFEIKKEAGNRFPDVDKLIIVAEPDIDYQTVVSTMDACKLGIVNGEEVVLFPEVSLSAGVF